MTCGYESTSKNTVRMSIDGVKQRQKGRGDGEKYQKVKGHI